MLLKLVSTASKMPITSPSTFSLRVPSLMSPLMALLSSFLKTVSSHSGFQGMKVQIQLFEREWSYLLHFALSALVSLQLRLFICWFCCQRSSFISSCSCLDSSCSLYCSYQSYSYSYRNLRKCSYEKRMVQSFRCICSLCSSISVLRIQFSFIHSSSFFFICSIFSRTSLSSTSIEVMLEQLFSYSSILALALASSQSFLRMMSLHLPIFSSYSSFILVSLFSKSQNLASFFLFSAALRLALLRCCVILQFLSFSSLSSMMRCSFAYIYLPSCYESTLIQACWRSILRYRQVATSVSLIWSIQ